MGTGGMHTSYLEFILGRYCVVQFSNLFKYNQPILIVPLVLNVTAAITK